MTKSNAVRVEEDSPIMLRRVTQKPKILDLIVNNMTVVSSPGRQPEMSDQMTDATAPRHD
ncbi:MAG: hypothetical protein WCS97_03780 [Candidatus Paceibacterota bacterium]